MTSIDVAEATKEKDDSGKNRKKQVLAFLGVLVILGTAFALYRYFFIVPFESTDDARVSAVQSVVSPVILGKLLDLKVHEGSSVQKNQVLAVLDNSSALDQKNQALVSIDQAHVKIEQAKLNEQSCAEGVTLARSELLQAQSDMARAQSQLKSAIISQKQYEQTALALVSARSGYNLALLKSETAKEAEKSSGTSLKQARNLLEEAENALTRTVLKSPFNGFVARKWVTTGDVVQPAQPIYTLCDLNHLWIDAYFKETQIRRLKTGQPVKITVDAYPSLPLAGQVERIGNTTAAEFALIPQDNSSGNYTKLTQRVPVRIVLSGRYSVPLLLPGMSVEVRVRIDR